MQSAHDQASSVGIQVEKRHENVFQTWWLREYVTSMFNYHYLLQSCDK